MTISSRAIATGTRIPLAVVSGSNITSGSILIQTPATGRIVLRAFQLQNESSTATTIVLRNGTREIWRVLCQNQGDGCGYDFGTAGLILNEGLNLNWTLSGANSCGYNILYYIETVL